MVTFVAENEVMHIIPEDATLFLVAHRPGVPIYEVHSWTLFARRPPLNRARLTVTPSSSLLHMLSKASYLTDRCKNVIDFLI